MRVSVIIPTHNEALAIGRVLADLPSNFITEVIVVDSNSTDGTPDLARRMGAQVIQEPRRGYGRACLTGLANMENPDVVVFLDGDYSDRPSELPILLAPIIEGRADITLGSRTSVKGKPGALPWHQSFGNRLAAGLIRLLYGVKVVGPTHDGGYYLVGAKASHPSLFEGDGMGTRTALDRLLTCTKVLELSIGFTEPFYDIDVANDLILLARELRLAPAKAPRTAVWFREWEEAVAYLHQCLGEL